MVSSEEWLTPEEAAGWLGVPVAVVIGAVEDGQLPALQLGNYIRISRQALVNAASRSAAAPVEDVMIDALLQAAPDATDADSGGRMGIPQPERLRWQTELQPTENFTYSWPRAAGATPGSGDEPYKHVEQATVDLNGHLAKVRVGEATRLDRGRLTVWIDGHPTAEFVETTDGRHWASLIRPDSRAVLREGEPTPPLYRGTRIEPYRDATGLAGRGIPIGLAAIVARDDRRSAVHHAAARWLPRQYDGFVVRPVRSV